MPTDEANLARSLMSIECHDSILVLVSLNQSAVEPLGTS